jgi:uncharacterized membrane protein YsdA (DUF1294 family)
MKLLLLYLLIINLYGFGLMVADKQKARKGNWRIPEKKLFLVGLLGAASGMFVAMNLIRHKTKHISFMLGFPLMIGLHIAIYLLCF